MAASIPERLTWAVALLDVRPGDHVLEVGCGRGVAATLICEQLQTGRLVAIDRSAKAIEAARLRNAAHVEAGRASFRHAALAGADLAGERFDKVLAVNVNTFWLRAEAELAVLRRSLTPAGRLLLVYELPGPEKRTSVLTRARRVLEAEGFAVLAVHAPRKTRLALCGIEARPSPFTRD